MKYDQAHKSSAVFKCFAIVGAISALAACGGGSSSTQLTVTGTAATGKALDGAAISVTCKTGTGTATSNSAGNYSASITDGKGPCVLTATKGATTLRSIAPGAGVANITPLTDLLTNYLATRAGTSVSNLLSNTNGTAILSDSKAISDGQTDVANSLKTNFGVTISTTNFLSTTITTPTGGTQNNADKDLDLLKTNNLVGTDGNSSSTSVTTIVTDGQKKPYTGSTGATGS